MCLPKLMARWMPTAIDAQGSSRPPHVSAGPTANGETNTPWLGSATSVGHSVPVVESVVSESGTLPVVSASEEPAVESEEAAVEDDAVGSRVIETESSLAVSEAASEVTVPLSWEERLEVSVSVVVLPGSELSLSATFLLVSSSPVGPLTELVGLEVRVSPGVLASNELALVSLGESRSLGGSTVTKTQLDRSRPAITKGSGLERRRRRLSGLESVFMGANDGLGSGWRSNDKRAGFLLRRDGDR